MTVDNSAHTVDQCKKACKDKRDTANPCVGYSLWMALPSNRCQLMGTRDAGRMQNVAKEKHSAVIHQGLEMPHD